MTRTLVHFPPADPGFVLASSESPILRLQD